MPNPVTRSEVSNNNDNSSNSKNQLQFIDSGANLLDERFTAGIYRGTFRHENDLDCVLQRAASIGMKHIILTAGTIQESRLAVDTARQWNTKYSPQMGIHFSCTVGVHPTRCQQVFEPASTSTDAAAADHGDDYPAPDTLLDELLQIAVDGMQDGTVVAVGEIGLDYDRLEFCPAQIQQKYLIRQLQHIAAPTKLPLFLHNRNVGTDLFNILQSYCDCWQMAGGVVHSFDDSIDLAHQFIFNLGLYIGLNGCSLRTVENLHVVSQLPLDRIVLETDCPYCEIRSSHAGYNHIQTHFPSKAEKKFERGITIKNRQEPCHIIQVAEIVAGSKGIPLQQVVDACYHNARQLYRWQTMEST